MAQNPTNADAAYQDPLETYLDLAQRKFYASEKCVEARRLLTELVENPNYETTSEYFVTDLGFCDRHLDYLSKNPNIDLTAYLSNLRLMTRKRR